LYHPGSGWFVLDHYPVLAEVVEVIGRIEESKIFNAVVRVTDNLTGVIVRREELSAAL
jgi:hypothetical protein